MSEAEYAADGRLMVWRGRTLRGSVERVYSNDAAGKLVSITGTGSDITDEVHYDDQGRRTEMRTVPPRPGRETNAFSTEIMFDVAEEGDDLNRGGTVTTRYNDDDQPVESLVRDTHGLLLTRITHNYADGRLVSEMLVRGNFDLPKEFLEGPSGGQLSEQQQRALRAQMKEMLSQSGFDRAERSYFYDGQGRVARLLTLIGTSRQETTTTYNEHGDKAGIITIHSGSLLHDNSKLPSDSRFEIRYLYEYDTHGNWTEQTTVG
jgi:hypothetical protein